MAEKKEWVVVPNKYIGEDDDNVICQGKKKNDPEVYFPKSASKVSADKKVSVEKWFLDAGI